MRVCLNFRYPGQCLDDWIIDTLVDIGTGFADAANREVHQPRVALERLVGTEPQTLSYAGAKVLRKDISFFDISKENKMYAISVDILSQLLKFDLNKI